MLYIYIYYYKEALPLKVTQKIHSIMTSLPFLIFALIFFVMNEIKPVKGQNVNYSLSNNDGTNAMQTMLAFYYCNNKLQLVLPLSSKWWFELVSLALYKN
jgi:hypothetical protein